MAENGFSGAVCAISRMSGLVAAVAGCLMLGACAQVDGLLPSSQLAKATTPQTTTGNITTAATATTSATGPAATATAATPAANAASDTARAERAKAELVKATEYWGNAFNEDPRDPQKALNFARNLKALGEKQKAYMVLQQAAAFNGTNRAIAGEYGRLALEFEQVTLAQKLLDEADDPAKPDWKLISARGTARAKQGLYREAIPFYERALALAPDQSSVLSNLALAYASVGEPEKAEPLLKRAMVAGRDDPRVNQNLALILGLQGKYDEAKLVAGRDLPPDRASADVDYMQKIVQAKPKPLEAPKVVSDVPTTELKGPTAATAKDGTGWATQVATSKP